MHFAYYDESGDDGFPKYSSPLFALSALYFDEADWRWNFSLIREFRRNLRKKCGLLIGQEIHTRHFILNKKPYGRLRLPDAERVEIITDYCRALAQLRASSVNVVIVKPRIKKATYDVLDTAFSYSIQRIDNDLAIPKEPYRRFLVVTDYGRVGNMVRTARRMQRINPVPSRWESGRSAQHPIDRLLGDPLPQNSAASYFIQASDLLAYVVYHYMIGQVTKAAFPSRLPSQVDDTKLKEWLDILLPILNVKASTRNEHGYGIVAYPRR